VDKDKENAKLNLVLFDRTFTATADGDTFDPSDADLANCIGHVYIADTDYLSFNDNSEATVKNIGKILHLNGEDLYGQLVCVATPTYTATSDLTVKVGVLQD
jgi:hypothetical protein